MGCSGSPGWFQSIMARVCEGLELCRLYIDGICTFSKNGAEHVSDLTPFLERLTKFNLNLAPKKAHLGAGEVTILGHCIAADGILSDPRRVDAFRLMPMPTNVSESRSPMGGLSHYREYTPKLASRKKALNGLCGMIGGEFCFLVRNDAVFRVFEKESCVRDRGVVVKSQYEDGLAIRLAEPEADRTLPASRLIRSRECLYPSTTVANMPSYIQLDLVFFRKRIELDNARCSILLERRSEAELD